MTRGGRGRAARALVQAGLLVAVLALIWGAVWLQLQHEYAATEREAVKETGNFALAFEENIIRSITAIDQVILFVRDSYARDPVRFDLTTWARDRPFLNDQTFQIALIDSNGALVQSNLPAGTEPVTLADREHFHVHLAAAQDQLFISRPLLGRVSNRYSVQFTRRVIGADGEFLGVVVASVDPYYLARFYQTLQIGDGYLLLVGLDGYVRASHPTADLIGRPLANSPLLQLAGQAGYGSYQVAAAVASGRPAIVSYRRLADYPLVVAVGYGAGAVFAGYRLHRFEYLLAGTMLSALTLCIALLLARHRRSLARYQDALTATLENISQGIVMVDRDRRVAVINRRAGKLLGLPPELIRAGVRFDDILSWQWGQGEFDASHHVTAPMNELLARGGFDADVPVYERTRPNGIVLEVRSALLPNGGVVRTYTDITERQRNAQELATARDAAEAAGRARSQFLAAMSHEIRTPMNGIIGAAGLLQDRPLGQEELRYVQIIRQSGDHLLQIINDILDFSRLDADSLELEEVPFELRATIAGAVAMLDTGARTKGLALTLTVPDDVPERASGDPARLRQVLLNLIGNAIKFTEHGSVSVEAQASRESGSIRLAVAVTDTGIGIAAEALPRLFREFSQVDGSISRRFGGSGLGLAISRRLVERMGGTLTVDSRPGQGSTFRFDALLREAAAPAPAEATPAKQPRGTLPRLRVLLVEDNDTNRLLASRMVERMGHRVDAVADGEEAVRSVRRMPYDLILMDVMMPRMDGLTATSLIRREPAPVGQIPIIGLTADAQRSKEWACYQAGMDAFVSKPVTAGRLAAAIEQVMLAPTASRTQASPLLDDQVLGQLAADIGIEGAVEVVDVFLAEAPRMLERLEQACISRDRALLREVHTLASAARSVGLLRVGQAAADIEGALATGEPAPASLAALLDLLRTSIDELASWYAANQPVAAEIKPLR